MQELSEQLLRQVLLQIRSNRRNFVDRAFDIQKDRSLQPISMMKEYLPIIRAECVCVCAGSDIELVQLWGRAAKEFLESDCT